MTDAARVSRAPGGVPSAHVDTYAREHLPPRAGLHELRDGDGVAAQDPVPAFENAVPFPRLGVGIGDDNEPCRYQCREPLQPDVDAFHGRSLKVIARQPGRLP